jgi:hypothetical protein
LKLLGIEEQYLSKVAHYVRLTLPFHFTFFASSLLSPSAAEQKQKKFFGAHTVESPENEMMMLSFVCVLVRWVKCESDFNSASVPKTTRLYLARNNVWNYSREFYCCALLIAGALLFVLPMIMTVGSNSGRFLSLLALKNKFSSIFIKKKKPKKFSRSRKTPRRRLTTPNMQCSNLSNPLCPFIELFFPLSPLMERESFAYFKIATREFTEHRAIKLQ